ncbi:MAG: sulfite exporter TauE/SafE family protein [Proteobacteria bacterium]|nr:sulfite exporter TauE/SafE family protein [Pseudomonadota bacterium]
MAVPGLDAYSIATLAFVAGAAFVAGLARGFSGFGAALIFIPLASTVVGPKVAAPLLLLIDVVAAAALIPRAWRAASRRDVGTMLAGTVVGIPLGTWILMRSDPVLIRWLIAAGVFAMLIVLVSGWRYRRRPTTALSVGVGAMAGLFTGAAQIGGPPIIVYWLGGTAPALTVRANFVLYFAASAAIAILSYIVAGVMTRSVLPLAVFVGPLYALGLWLGSRMFALASERIFRTVCYALIAVAALISLPLFDGLIR